MSMTGMSSLTGYTRLQVPHLSAVPFFTGVTGVLQFGHARISSSSGSTAMAELYDTFALLWNNSPMKVSVSFPAVVAVVSLAVSGGTAQPAAAQTPPSAERGGEAYAQFLLGRHLETADDIDGAIVAFKRAAQLDPQASDVAAELSGLYMRQSRL